MTNATYHKRLNEISLNEGLRGGEFWEILDTFAPKMYYFRPMYGCNEVSGEFISRLPEFRKWMKARGLRWFRTWEEREEWFESDEPLDVAV